MTPPDARTSDRVRLLERRFARARRKIAAARRAVPAYRFQTLNDPRFIGIALSVSVMTGIPPVAQPQETQALSEFFHGTWSTEKNPDVPCIDARCLHIDMHSDTSKLVIEDNQIVIDVRYWFNREKQWVEIFLIGPSDLGRGGMSLPWAQMDEREPIGRIERSAACAL